MKPTRSLSSRVYSPVRERQVLRLLQLGAGRPAPGHLMLPALREGFLPPSTSALTFDGSQWDRETKAPRSSLEEDRADYVLQLDPHCP